MIRSRFPPADGIAGHGAKRVGAKPNEFKEWA